MFDNRRRPRFRPVSASSSLAFAIAVILVLAVVFCSCSDSGSGSHGDSDPEGLHGANLLLITLDTTRADALGCYGSPLPATPHLDRLAREGVRFDQARTVCPITLPAHASILTGLFPFEHGVRDNSIFQMPEGVTSLAERLNEAGYATGAVMGAFVLHSHFGLDQGFDVYSDVPRRCVELTTREDQRRADEVVDTALGLLAGPGSLDAPFFLWVHFFDPHWPYEPPRAAQSRLPRGVPPGASPVGRQDRLSYMAEVAFTDSEIARLVTGVDARSSGTGLLTVVVADHGEGLGQHGERTHGFHLYDTTIRVPLILHHAALPAGLVIETPVSVVDLAPTIERLLGVEPHPSSGADLTPLLFTGREPEGDRPIYFESCMPYYGYNWSPLFGLVQAGGKLVEAPQPWFFDLQGDPGEAINLYDSGNRDDSGPAVADRSALVAEMRLVFGDLQERMREAAGIDLDAEQRRLLQQMGYTGASVVDAEGAAPLPGRIIAGLRGPEESLKLLDKRHRVKDLAFPTAGERDMGAAIRLMKELVEEEPQNPNFLSHLGILYYRAGRYDDAVTVLSKAIERHDIAYARTLFADALDRLGRRGEALDTLRDGLKLNPNVLLFRAQLSQLLVIDGRGAEALEHIAFFLDAYRPDDDWRRKMKTLESQAQALVARDR